LTYTRFIISFALLCHFRRSGPRWRKPTPVLTPQFLVLLASNFTREIKSFPSI